MKKITAITIRSLIVLPVFLWIFSSLGEAATTQVDCSSASLQAAVEKARPGDTLLVSGTCNENLVIEEVARITLGGQGKSTINGPDASKSTIEVRGRGITIKGFTVTGGRNVIAVTRGGQAVIDGNTVQGAARTGIHVSKTSYSVIVNNTVQNNGRIGILISASSFGWVGFLTGLDKTASPNIVQNNGHVGIVVGHSSAARIVGNTIRNNKRAGVTVHGASQANISNNTIDGNGRAGISIRNSDVRLGRRRGSGIFRLPNSTTSNNSRVGIRCRGNSSVSGRLGSLNGNKGAKDIDPSCVDSLKPDSLQP
ncbi:MAG: nitrous oxide reductase family maturation protein NosD [Candidatus Binatia bacterium]